MKKSLKITCCGIISALAVVLMLATNIPIMLYAIPAVCGMLFMIPAVEFGTKWALLCYAVTSVLSLILPTEKEALVMFIGLLGYYPVLKMLVERLGKRVIEYVIKLAVFNAAVILSYTVIIKLLGINAFEGSPFGIKATAAIFLVIGNAVFLLFDAALTKLLRLYFVKLRKNVRRMLGIKGKY